MSRRIRAAGFTLLEVMLGLALLGFALVMLIKSTTGNMTSAKNAQMMGVVADLARGKMYDIEEKLLKEGFTDTDQSEEDKTFEEEGWPEIAYSYKVQQVELPSYDQLQSLAAGSGSAGSGSGSGSGSGDGEPTGSFQDSALGGMLSMLGGGFAGGASQDIDSKAGASFIQTYYQLVQDTLKAAIRKVTLTIKYKIIDVEYEVVTVAFFTEPSAMDKVIPFGGGGDPGGGSGSGSGSNPGGGGGGGGGGAGSGSGKKP